MEPPINSINQMQIGTLEALETVERPTFQNTILWKIYHQTSLQRWVL